MKRTLLFIGLLWFMLPTFANIMIFEARDKEGNKTFSDREPVDERIVRQIDAQNSLAQHAGVAIAKEPEIDEHQAVNNQKIHNYLQAKIQAAQNKLEEAQQRYNLAKNKSPTYDNSNSPSDYRTYQNALEIYRQQLAGLESNIRVAKSELNRAIAEANTYKIENE